MKEQLSPNYNKKRTTRRLATAAISGIAAVSGVMAATGNVAGAANRANKPKAPASKPSHEKKHSSFKPRFDGVYVENKSDIYEGWTQILRYFPDHQAWATAIQADDPQNVNQWLGPQCQKDGQINVNEPNELIKIQAGPFYWDKTGSFKFYMSRTKYTAFTPVSLSRDGTELSLHIKNMNSGYNQTVHMTLQPDQPGEQKTCEDN